MGEVITLQELQDASIDAANLGEAVNGNETGVVTPRDGEAYPTLPAAIQKVIQTGGFEPFLTETDLLASVPTVPKKAAKALNTKKIWYWDGSWHDTGLSEFDQAKAYADANPMFKPVAVVAGNNANNFTTPGLYTLSSNLAEGGLTNWPLTVNGFHQSGVIVVYGISIGATKLASQIFYPYINAYQPMFRANTTSGGAWTTTWDKLTLDSNKFNTIDLTTGQDVLTLGQGRYRTPTLTIGNSLINMPDAAYKFGVIEVDVVGVFKIVKFTPYGRVKSFYINSSYEGPTWGGWQVFSPISELQNTFPTKTELSSSISSALNNLTKDDYFGKQYTENEIKGTALYGSAYYVGLNSTTTTKGVSFNSVIARMFNTAGGETQYRVYMGSAVTSGSFGYNVTAANQSNYSFSGVCKSFPTSDTGLGQKIKLDQVVTIPPNTPFVIVFRKTVLSTIVIGYTTAVTGNLESRGFNLGATAVDWGVSNINNGSVPTFTQAGFQFLLNVESSSGSTPETYAPSLVLPPKVYALEGLESHLYHEHTLVEDYKLYEHDVTCAKGMQRKRGWVWTPTSGDAAGNYALTLSVHDKQKGIQLASASTTVVLANKNANSGITKKVCFIGDSLVNAGVITQRLLDIDATDVMNINLIGTRGTAPNLHEGRGGWTIDDYTTAGRTYYQFTVSGVVEVPAINATTYSFGGSVFMVQEAFVSGGSGTINCNLISGGAPTAGSSGVLTKTNASAGDASIAFSNVQPTAGNPFWGGSALNFANYLSANSLSAPDIVFIQLGVNDTFGLMTDAAVDSFTATAFPKLDLLIASIKAANPSVKIGVCSPPSYADQDAFGTNYGCGQTSWRAKRNIVCFNRNLFTYFKDKEVSNIFAVGSGINVDAENNYPTGTGQVNSHNTNTVTIQTNGVHPADSGYKQIGDALFAFIKAI